MTTGIIHDNEEFNLNDYHKFRAIVNVISKSTNVSFNLNDQNRGKYVKCSAISASFGICHDGKEIIRFLFLTNHSLKM